MSSEADLRSAEGFIARDEHARHSAGQQLFGDGVVATAEFLLDLVEKLVQGLGAGRIQLSGRGAGGG